MDLHQVGVDPQVAPLAVRWLARHWHTRAVRVGVYVSLGYSLVLILLLHSLFIYPWITFPEGKHPLAPVSGWPQAATRAAELRAALAAEPGPEPVLFVPNWALGSRLAWYARPLPVQVTDERFDQFDLWFGTPAAGARGVLVAPARNGKAIDAARGRFADCAEHEPLTVVAHGQPVVTFRFLSCRDYRPPAP